jgi:hypothetical protein
MASERLINQSIYDVLLDTFREHPGNSSRAAHEAGVSWPTAKRAWTSGWPDRGLRPIREAVEAERVAARSARAGHVTRDDEELLDHERALLEESRCVERERLRAQRDAIETRRQEALMVKLSRENTIALMGAVSRLVEVAARSAEGLDEKVRSGESELGPKETVRFVSSCTNPTRVAAEAAKLNVQMERMLLGQPTEIIGMDLRSMSLEEAERIIEMANRALERARQRGLLDQGGHQPN